MHNNKHAYLIMAHKGFDQLARLIALLDDPRNDIYLHVDKRAEGFDAAQLQTRHAGLHIVKRMVVNWGGHSQIECELRLLQAAVPGHYSYYHLISGVDLPLKRQDEIHAFFRENQGKNFIEFSHHACETGDFLFRIRYYHLFQNRIGRNRDLRSRVLRRIQKKLLRLQKKLKVSRKQYIRPYKGANWFSITDDLARYVLTQQKLIRRQFYFSTCADEVFLHSIAMASPYKDSIVDNCLREIDWERGQPYTYRAEDVPALLASGSLFARKFEDEVDPGAVQAIIDHLTKQ